MEGAIEGVALNDATDSRPVDPPAKRQNAACFGANHEMLVLDRALDATGLIRPFEVAANHTAVLPEIKKLGRGRSVGIIAVQGPFTRNAGRGLVLWWRLLCPCKVTGEDRQSKTKHKDTQAISLHPSLPVNAVHSKIYRNCETLSL